MKGIKCSNCRTKTGELISCDNCIIIGCGRCIIKHSRQWLCITCKKGVYSQDIDDRNNPANRFPKWFS